MWKQIFKLAKQFITLAEDMERGKTRLKELQDQVEGLTTTVHGWFSSCAGRPSTRRMSGRSSLCGWKTNSSVLRSVCLVENRGASGIDSCFPCSLRAKREVQQGGGQEFRSTSGAHGLWQTIFLWLRCEECWFCRATEGESWSVTHRKVEPQNTRTMSESLVTC